MNSDVYEWRAFQVGDRVRTSTNGECLVNYHHVMANGGKVGTIIEVATTAPFGHRFRVWFDEPELGWLASGFAAAELEPL